MSQTVETPYVYGFEKDGILIRIGSSKKKPTVRISHYLSTAFTVKRNDKFSRYLRQNYTRQEAKQFLLSSIKILDTITDYSQKKLLELEQKWITEFNPKYNTLRSCITDWSQIEVTHKICTKCNIEKPVSHFSPHKRYKDGYLSQCKLCVNENYKKYYKNNKEKCINKILENYYINRNTRLQYSKIYYKKKKMELKWESIKEDVSKV